MARFLFLLCVFLGLPSSADAADTVQSLCDGGVAGTYVGKSKAMPIRINIICLDSQRIVGSLADISLDPRDHSPAGALILSYTAGVISGNSLVLSTYGLGSDERHNDSSKTRGAYVKLSLASLKKGVAEGYFVNDNSRSFLQVSASLEKSFTPQPPAGPAFQEDDLIGAWTFQSSHGLATLLADVLGGIPSITLTFAASGNFAIHLLDGAAWDGSGLLSLATPQGDGEPDQKSFFYAYGHLLSHDELEVTYVSPISPPEGPYLAKRTNAYQVVARYLPPR